MVMSALRAYNAHHKDKALAQKEAPPQPLTLDDSALLKNNLNAASKQLRALGLKSNKQEGFSLNDFEAVLSFVKVMPICNVRHFFRSYFIFSTNWGGRVSEYGVIEEE